MGTKHDDKTFKEQAVKLCHERGNNQSVADELGVSRSQLRKWCNDYATYGSNSFPRRGNERSTDAEREIKESRKQLKDKELDIVKLNEVRAEAAC